MSSSGPLKMAWPKGCETADLVADHLDAVTTGCLKGQPGNGAGQSHAGRHVIVDADHVGAQTCIDRSLIRIAGPGGEIPIEVGHGRYLWFGPAWPGFGRPADFTPTTRTKSSAKGLSAPDGLPGDFAIVTNTSCRL